MNEKKLTTVLIWLLGFLAVAGLPGLTGEDTYSTWGSLLLEAKNKTGCFPVLSHKFPGASIEDAYGVQRYFVQHALAGKQPTGFKAGLTSEGAQKRFGVKEPVAGVLFPFAPGPGNRVSLKLFGRPMMETEIGMVIGKKITRPLKNKAELLEHIESIMPVIELPDLCFDDMKKLKSLDIIAANVSVKGYITGKKIPANRLDQLDINNIDVVLYKDKKPVNRGKGSDAMGDQWQAALWLINRMVKQGWKLEPGQFIITGALGRMIPAIPGSYSADFGSLGTIVFVFK